MSESELSPITLAPSMSLYFEEAVSDAMRVRQIEATQAASRYLVGILCTFAHPDEEAGSPLTSPLAFLLRDALEAVGAERFRRLRALGDGILYALGFFGGHIELRGVDREYVAGVGRSAYTHASAMLRLGASKGQGADVLSEMTAKFDRFVDVLADVAEGTIACCAPDQRAIVKLYERWLRTGSSRLASALGAHGIIPTRAAGLS